MPYPRPTVAQLMQQQSVDLSAQLRIPVQQVRRSNAGIIAKVQAGGLHGLHGHLEYNLKQGFEDTADAEYLIRKGDIRGIRRKLKTVATGSRLINGTNGAAVEAGALLQRSDGQQYKVTTGAVIASGTA